MEDSTNLSSLVDSLNAFEKSLLCFAITGYSLDLRSSPGNEMPVVRAETIIRLLTSPLTLLDEYPVAVRIRGASISGDLNLGGRELICPLDLVDCHIARPVILTKATGPNISFRGSHLRGLYANFVHIEGTLNIGNGFRCSGPVKLFAADLGELEAGSGFFDCPYGLAVNGDYMKVRSFASFERAVLRGTLRMLGAKISGQLDCSETEITAPQGESSIELDSAKIDGGVFFQSARLHGGVWMVGLEVSGELSFQNSWIDNPKQYAMDASSARLKNVNFADDLIEGEVKIVGSRLSSLDCYGSTLRGPKVASLDLDSTVIEGAFHAMFAEIEGSLDLTNTSIAVFRDTQSSWPNEAKLIGARYERIEGDEEVVGADRKSRIARLNWLKLDDSYHPQKYSAVAQAYKNVGQDSLARRVLMAGEHERRVFEKWHIQWFVMWVWSKTLSSLVGYGYAPSRAVWWLLALIGVGSVSTGYAHEVGGILRQPLETLEFNSVRYTVDLLFPVAGLPDSDAFLSVGIASWLTFGLSIARWFLAAVVVAGLSGLLQRK